MSRPTSPAGMARGPASDQLRGTFAPTWRMAATNTETTGNAGPATVSTGTPHPRFSWLQEERTTPSGRTFAERAIRVAENR